MSHEQHQPPVETEEPTKAPPRPDDSARSVTSPVLENTRGVWLGRASREGLAEVRDYLRRQTNHVYADRVSAVIDVWDSQGPVEEQFDARMAELRGADRPVPVPGDDEGIEAFVKRVLAERDHEREQRGRI